MSSFLLSQILAAVAFAFDLLAFQFKERRRVLGCLMIGGVLSAAHFFFLGRTTAGYLAFLFVVRVSIAMFFPSPALAALFVGLCGLTTILTYDSPLSLLACCGACLGTVSSFQKDDKWMRFGFLFACLIWMVHNVLAWTPVAVIQEICFLSGNIIGLLRFYRRSSRDST